MAIRRRARSLAGRIRRRALGLARQGPLATLTRPVGQILHRIRPPARVRLPVPRGFSARRRHLDLEPAAATHIGRQVVAEGMGRYEPEVYAMVGALLEAERIDTLLDIGANIGLFSLSTAALFGDRVRVTAFEPLPWLADTVVACAEANDLTLGVERVALSSSDGHAQFYVSKQSDTSSSLNPDFRPHASVVEVSVRKLDTFPVKRGTKLLMKVDTESTEPDVLDGAMGFIKEHQPWIICEVLKGRTEEALAERFAKLGYVGMPVRPDPTWAPAEIAGDPEYRYRDWLFGPGIPGPEVRRRFDAWLEATLAA